MKKKSSYILAGLAVIPIASALIFNSISNKTTYYLANEKGNRKEMSSVKLETLQCEGNSYVFNRKVTITADDIKVDKDNSFDLYGHYQGIKANKDLFRGKMLNEQFIDENEKYACYASVEQAGLQYYIDLYIKDLKSGDIKNKRYDLDYNSDNGYFHTKLVKISGRFVNIVLQKSSSNNETSEDTESLVNYKFDLATGNFLKKFDIGRKIMAVKTDSSNNIYCVDYNNNKNDSEGTPVFSLVIYNVTNDTTEKTKLPKGFDVNTVIENNGGQYLFSYTGEMIERTSDGKLKDTVKLIDRKDNENSGFSHIKVKDNKVYGIYSRYDGHGQKCEQETIKIFSIDTGKELYSGDIMKKGAFDSKGQPAGGAVHIFI